jgi:uncharacterized membrane protein
MNDKISSSKQMTRRIAIVLLLASLCVSAILLGKTWLNKPIPGCGVGADCQTVLASKWASVAGIPISLPGIILYGALIVLVLSARRYSKPLLSRFETAGCLLVVFGAVWFYLVQALILHAFCPWCCSVHAMASTAAILLMVSRRGDVQGVGWPHAVRFAFRIEVISPVILMVAFALYQSSEPERENIVDTRLLDGAGVEADGSQVSVYNGQYTFEPSAFPMMGSPDSDRVMVVLTDYTCPHCRSLHETFREFVNHQGGDVAIVFLPAFRDQAAQELHRVMLTVWKDDPAFYETLSSGMITGDIPADPKKVLTLAQSHNAGRFYEKAWAHASWVEQCFQLGQGILAANDKRLEVSSLPQIMVGDKILQGKPSLETLSALLIPSPPVAAVMVAAVIEPPVETQVEEANGEAKLEFESKDLTLPTVPRGEKASKTFYFTNTGTSPLKISGVKVGCGCMVADGWKQTVLPGERGSFQISLDTARQAGAVRKSILITSNATNIRGGVLTLLVKGEVWLPVKLSQYTAHYGVIPTGETASPKKITMTLTDDGPFDLAVPTCSNDYFKTTWEETKPGKEYVLTVTIPELHRQREQGEIRIPLGHSKYPELKIPVSARVADVIEPSPSFLMLSSTPPRAPQSRLITVYCHNRKFKDFKIIGYNSSGSDGIDLKLKPKRSPYWRQIEVTFPAGFDPVKAVSQKTSIRIQTNYPGGKELVIPLRVQLRGATARRTPSGKSG